MSLHDRLCGRTLHAFYGGGNQIEYMRADGRSFFWQYGRSDVVEGEWWVTMGQDTREQICFSYDAGAFSENSPEEEHCLPGDPFMENVGTDGMRDGDPYNLASGTAPFYLIAWPRVPASNLSIRYPDVARDGACNGAFM